MSSPSPNLVSAQWLSDNLGSVVILDASVDRGVDAQGLTTFGPGGAVFARHHIPTARFADLFEVLSDPGARFPFTYPTRAQMSAAAAHLGLDQSTEIVVYDQLSGAYAARVWLVLRAYGFAHTRVLDGGFAEWQRLGYGVETAAPPLPASQSRVLAEPALAATSAEGAFARHEEVATIVAQGRNAPTLVCGLRTPDYTGESGGTRPGHIPGSVSMPYPDLLDESGKVSVAQTRAAAADLGIGVDDEVVVYCGGGINAAGVALALVEAGYRMPRVYDGSMNQWRADPDLPLVTGRTPR